MERGKGTAKRGPKSKTLAPPGVFIALGSKSARGGSAETSDSKLSSTQHKPGHGLSLAGSSGERKRESTSTSPSLSIPSKKPKLSTYPLAGSIIRSSSIKKDKDIKKGDQWDSLAIEVDPQNLMSQILEAEDNSDEERVEGLLCGSVKTLRQTRSKPEPSLYITLLYLAKVKPYMFFSENLIEAFSSLLKRDSTLNFKTKSNAVVSILAANILLSIHQDEKNWPESFVKVYLEDAIGERVWIDHEDCRGFVDNIITAFNTKIPSKHLMPHEFGFKPDVCPSPSSLEDDDTTESATSSNSRDKLDVAVQNRYTHLQDSLEQYVLEMVRDQFQRRQPMDSISRNMLRLLSSTCGYSEIRLMVAQRLEMWLQNSKLMKPSQELLMSVCHNCNQHNQQDIEVISHLIKIRLKTKPLINYYLICIKELLNQHSDNLGTLLKHTIYNELSNSRNPNNMSLLGVMFQHTPEASAKILAEVFQDLLANRDDYLRALRALFREIVRSLRYDLNFVAFCLGLMQERKDPLFRDLETQIKERMFLSIADLITLSIFMSITPSVREAAAAYARGDKKDISTLRAFQQQVAIIQRDAVWWLHVVSPKMYKPGRNEFVHCLHKVLLMEQGEHYYNKDNWPPENDRLMMLRLSSEIPVLEDTLMRILIIGLSKEHPLNAPDAHELADQLVKRAAALYAEDFLVINVERMELIDALFNLCAYHHPENISLPAGYQPPSLAISSLYWKSWIMLLIITAHNPASFGFAAWDSYPTLRGFIEMCITNHFIFPPPTMAVGDKAEEIKNHELQISHMEKQEILEFENHLASASTKVTITESNSLLLPQLTTMDPSGLARRPPSHVLEQLKLVNQNLKLGHLLCRSRNPDFLLEIIQRQGTSQSMPWLADLVESSEGAFNVLPVQCLCEFLLNDPPEICKSQAESDKEDTKDGKEESKAEKAEKAKKKEKQQKQQQLLKHLQNLLYDSGDDSRPTQEVLDYFLRRLSSQQSTSRLQATMGLTMVLCPTIRLDEEDDEEMHTEKEDKIEYNWLLKYLPNLPHFDSIRASASVALRQACQIETNPWAVSAYIQFLSNYAPDEQLQESADLALNMAQLIIERTTILNYILPSEEASPREQKTSSLQALMTIFLKYLRKAREPSKEAYSWSESQDQIIIQWASGEAATMHILVVHAMVILLTYGPPQDPTLFDELLEIWFPSTFDPPQAFLVDTSEEALLLPDWLKLRMIRSNVSVLVDAALKDLEPTQLVLFIQSFGIPVSSVSKLLQALDFAVECNRYAVDQAVGDKGYMSQLVEVQQQRGAEGGNIFAQLLDVGSLPSEGIADESISEPRREALIIPTKPVSQITSDVHPNSLYYIFTIDPSCMLSPVKQQELFRPLQKVLSLEARSVEKLMTTSVLQMLDQLITSREGYLYVTNFHKSATIACPLFRILLISLEKAQGMLRMQLISVAEKILSLSNSFNSPLTKLLEQIKKLGKTPKKPDERQKIYEDKPELSEEYIIREIKKAAQVNKSHLEYVVSRFMDEGMKSKCTKPLIAALTKLLLQSCDNRMTPASLFVDWLEVLEPEIIQSVPHLQEQLLFAHQFPNSDNKRHPENVRSFRPYLLALLTHRASWETLHYCINLTLEECRFDPVAVLDFLWACIYIPKIWQGRDKHSPKNRGEECLLGLTKQQAVCVADYILEEALYINGKKDKSEIEIFDKNVTPGEPRRELELEKSYSLQAAYVKSLEARLPLLLHCGRDCKEVIVAIADHLMDIIDTNKTKNLPANCLLQLLYLEVPQVVTWVSNPSKILKDTQISQKCSSKMDNVSHTLLSTLSSTESGKDWNDKMEDVDLACRKLASTHPILLLRQLPMLAASLRGRTQLDFHVFKDRHHLIYFNRILGLLELLQPHLFRKEFSPSLENTLESFFDLIRNHGGQQKELGGIINRFLILLHNFIAEENQRAVRYIQKHSNILHDLSSIYPDLQSLRSLLAGISLPSHGERDELKPALLSFTLSQTPSSRIQAQLAPLLAKLTQRDSVEETLSALQELDALSQRKPEYLEHFVEDLKQFLMDSRESCRNISHNLILRYIKLKPRCAEAFLNSFLSCLDSDQHDVVIAALERLGEFALLCQESASVLLQKAFSIGISTCINTLPYITETMNLLNMQTGS